MKKNKRCQGCNGTGHTRRELFHPPPEPEEQAVFDALAVKVQRRFFSWITCPACNGTGKRMCVCA